VGNKSVSAEMRPRQATPYPGDAGRSRAMKEVKAAQPARGKKPTVGFAEGPIDRDKGTKKSARRRQPTMFAGGSRAGGAGGAGGGTMGPHPPTASVPSHTHRRAQRTRTEVPAQQGKAY
jgi:hypothetical protein